MVSLSVRLAGVELKNPVIPASGTFGYGREYAELYDLDLLGSFSWKGTTAQSRPGNPQPRIAETASGMLNAVGLQNPGIDAVIAEELPKLKECFHKKVIANVSGFSVGEYAETCALLDREEQGLLTTGWTRGVYPTEQTARDALRAGTLYVMEREGRVTAAAKIDQSQMEQYSRCRWQHDAPPEQVLVLHTLVVDPAVKGRGCGTAFVRFYEELARTTGRPYLRIDTNARNTPARALYARLGYTEAGIVAGTFNGIPGVELVCLEKKV